MTLEQARVFEAVARLGTIQKAATELNRGHSAVVYSLKCLEQQAQLVLFDRGGHRNQLTREGEIVLKYCRRLLETQLELAAACVQINEGWEASLKLIYDEVVDFNLIGNALFQLNESKPPTEIKVLSAHLNEVEELFEMEKAEMMVTILPFSKSQMSSYNLPPIHMQLVAHKAHPLARKTTASLSNKSLNEHTFISIKIPSGPIGLSTEGISFDSYFFVNSFMTKKLAIMNKLGFGWLPDYLIEEEIRKGTLVVLDTHIKNKISVFPKLYYRPYETLGRTSKGLLKFLMT